MPKAVVADLHGDVAALMGVLELIGAVDAAGRKQPGWWLCQIGDAVHGLGEPKPTAPTPFQVEFMKRQAMDMRTMEKLFDLFDLVLIGNHEFQFFGGPSFDRGDHKSNSPVAHSMRDFYKAGCLKAATNVGPWLITHAGLLPHYWSARYDVYNLDAAELATRLNTDLEEALASGIELPYNAKPPIFWSLGTRWQGPGRMPPGGIFWADWHELGKGYAELWPDGAPDGALKQLVGHTPLDAPRKAAHYPIVNIDVGAGLNGKTAVAVTHDDGASWTTHVFKPS